MGENEYFGALAFFGRRSVHCLVKQWKWYLVLSYVVLNNGLVGYIFGKCCIASTKSSENLISGTDERKWKNKEITIQYVCMFRRRVIYYVNLRRISLVM